MNHRNGKSVSAREALRKLFENSRLQRRPHVTYIFLGLCFSITIPTLLFPDLYSIFGGIEPRQYPWQLVTSVFEHGWPGFHGSFHLALNSILILLCGPPCERLLGSFRFAMLSALSVLANAAAQVLTEGVNGSSLVIWAWGPSLFVALLWARKNDGSTAVRTESYVRIKGILILMYGVIVGLMGLLPYLDGWRGNPLVALFMGNLYHIVATTVGIGFAWFQKEYIKRRLRYFGS